MYAVNSKNETIEIKKGNAIRFLSSEKKLERMKIIGAVLKKNFRENVDFTYAHQPLYTNEAIIFYCRTKFSSASKIVCDALEIEKHLDEPPEKIDLMRSLFQCKEDGRMCWYYLTVGMYIIERNFYDCEPINIRYVQPVSYYSFLRSFKNSLITEEETEKGKLCKKYAVLDGLDIDNVASLLSHSFLRDMAEGMSEKDNKMFRFAGVWKQNKISPDSEYSNVATLCFMSASTKRKDCYRNYQEVKNMIVKTYKGSYGISYKDNTIKATLPDGRKITVYVYGTEEFPEYLYNGRMVRDVDMLRELIVNKDKQENKWFTNNVKPYL